MIRNCSTWFKTIILCKKKSFYSCFPPVPTFFPFWSAVTNSDFPANTTTQGCIKKLLVSTRDYERLLKYGPTTL